MAVDHENDLLTIAEATRILKVSRVTLHRWIRDGRLRGYHTGPRAVRIRRGDLEATLRRIYTSDEREPQPQLSPEPAHIRPLTEDEIQRGRAALATSQRRIEQMRAVRGGIPYAESWPLIREERAQREQRP